MFCKMLFYNNIINQHEYKNGRYVSMDELDWHSQNVRTVILRKNICVKHIGVHARYCSKQLEKLSFVFFMKMNKMNNAIWYSFSLLFLLEPGEHILSKKMNILKQYIQRILT
jgi:hypothetical protein